MIRWTPDQWLAPSAQPGHLSAGVSFPRVPGIEAAGTVDAAPAGSRLALGQKVVAMMEDMGRTYDGGYAEYTSVPLSQVIPVDTALPGRCSAPCRRWCRPPTARSPSAWT
jgi:NADPH:quinone reductase-like Zn-dependent oxidoreductase